MTTTELVPGMVVSVPTGRGVVIASGKKKPNITYYTNDDPGYYPVSMLMDDGKITSFIGEATLVEDPQPVHHMIRNTITASHLAAGMSVTAGMDPEVFAVTPTGECIPAFEYLPSKETPVGAGMCTLTGLPAAQVFYDGFQAEFTILPQGCHGYTTDYVRQGLIGVLEAARKHTPNAVLSVDSVVHIPREQRMAVNPIHLALGCAPSMNAYKEPRLAVPDPMELEVRFAGAHMHFGFTPSNPTPDINSVVKLLDAIVGVAMVGMGEGLTIPDRRRYYGRAGEYRWHPGGCSPTNPWDQNKPSRLEYRVPDTLLLSHPATFNALWDFTRVVFRMGMAGLGWLWEAGEDEVRQCINEGDVKVARGILDRNRNVLRTIITKANPAWGCPPKDWLSSTERLFFGGLGEVVARPRDIIGNWWLERPMQKYVGEEVAKNTLPNPDEWLPESYSRKPAYWPTGRIWSHAAMVVAGGGRV